MISDGIHINDIGTVFEVTIYEDGAVLDISDATTMQILLKAPDEGLLTNTAVFTTNGMDGKIQYVAIAGDLDEAGRWSIQARVVTPAGDWRSSISEFTVHTNL